MQDKSKSEFVLPTGSWLAKERQRLGKTQAEVAKAVRRHIKTVRALEQNNRVIPPGWCQDLCKLGMNVPEPAWPVPLQPYCGAHLHSDLQTRVGFRNSRYWLSKELCVTEAAVTDVIQHNRIVPPSWLLKLAELGASVPAAVRTALKLGTSGGSDSEAPASRPASASLWEHPGAAQPRVDVHSAGPASPQRERESVYMNWTAERGLHFSISAALLEQIPAVFKELLTVLAQIGQQSARPGQSTPTPKI